MKKLEWNIVFQITLLTSLLILNFIFLSFVEWIEIIDLYVNKIRNWHWGALEIFNIWSLVPYFGFTIFLIWAIWNLIDKNNNLVSIDYRYLLSMFVLISSVIVYFLYSEVIFYIWTAIILSFIGLGLYLFLEFIIKEMEWEKHKKNYLLNYILYILLLIPSSSFIYILLFTDSTVF